MSKHARVEAIRKLKEQLATATDPETIVKITNSIAKLSPRPRQARRPRRVEATVPSSKKVSILDRVTGSAVDQLPDGEKVFHGIIEQVEKMQREQHRHLTADEQKAVIAKLIDELSARDRLALESRYTEKVQREVAEIHVNCSL
jgi:molybdopterin converting factor small subunit